MMMTPRRVFVLLFNAGPDNEGIHTIRVGDRNKVLMFESEDDATRFAVMLEAQDFPVPTVEAIDAEEIKDFCDSADYDWELVPEGGALVMPPENNVPQPDWNEDSNTIDEVESQDISSSELDSIRRKLEGLL